MIGLGSLGGDSTVAYAINSTGDIVGYSTCVDGSMHAFVAYNNQQVTDLNIPGGHADALGINRYRQVIGNYQVSEQIQHAFLYYNGTFSDINGNNDQSTAPAINDSGEIVGDANVNNVLSAFLYKNGVMYNLNELIEPGLGIYLGGAKLYQR